MLNPLTYTENVVRSFLRYQLTAYPFADSRLNAQMRKLLSLDETRRTPLLKGPYVSLSRAFQAGASIEQLVKDKVLHEHMRHIVPFPALYGHQERAIRAIRERRPTLISTGTGSGKSECFLYPIISRCLELRDTGAAPGICAVIVYPMNALAEDQLGRLRELLAGSGITFGMYVGKTPEREADVVGVRLQAPASREAYRKELAEVQKTGLGAAVHPPEEVCSRELMRKPGGQPRLLLTNVKQLELLLTRHSDVELFDNARLEYLVFDEAHTFSGAEGAETACLIRRLRSFCGRSPEDTACIATSATIVDPTNPDTAQEFASRFFGVPQTAVTTVNELYEVENWHAKRTLPKPIKDPVAALDAARGAADASDGGVRLCALWKELTGKALEPQDWEGQLFDALTRNELLYQAAQALQAPKAMSVLVEDLAKVIGRPVAEEELLTWLILGSAARRAGRPLVRPVVHAFVRGVPGAVVSFRDEDGAPDLHLSAEEDDADAGKRLHLPVSTCTTCGQHYFEHALAGFDYTGAAPGGGRANGDTVCWEPMDVARGGVRLLLLDRLISTDGADDEDDPEHPKLSTLHLCRVCGAAHNRPGERCHACGQQGGRVALFAVQQKAERVGFLPACVCCGAHGRLYAGRFREPAKPVRAVNVADIHVLAQDMEHHAERKRLLVFADNRQDAAFQAGWMRDHARRFRLRALMAAEISHGPISVGDLVHRLDKVMDGDDSLSMALLPELWAIAPTKEAGGTEHRNQRLYLLRIQILLELTLALRQQIGLEPWGRIKVNYLGLDESLPFFQTWARRLRIPADELVGGVAALLDMMRRKRVLFDSVGRIFSHFWAPGARELESGYMPELRGIPKGVKLTRGPTDDDSRVDQFLSPGHQTTASQVAAKWGVPDRDVPDFLGDLWRLLTDPDVGALHAVTLAGPRGNALPNCHGTHQVDGDRLQIVANATGVFRCRTCRRRTVRRTPHMKCLAWRCNGELEHVPEDPDNYDLQLIDGDYALLRPREHTAMVPNAEREKLENMFKGDSDAVNALVCTQTLELGVDIGALDAVLMRNVPPLPANYWQRVGRAGRRHRMAVNLTYCRPVSHDRAYFAAPEKMLGGRVDPPCFNLSNDLMVAKHVHATVLTVFHQLTRANSGLGEADRKEITEVLARVMPPLINGYLFDEIGSVRSQPLDVGGLHTLITKHLPRVQAAVSAAFTQGWPAADAAVVQPERLTACLLQMRDELAAVVKRLHRRLMWAMGQMEQLDKLRQRTGALDEEQEAFFDRCRRYVGKLKGRKKRDKRQAEGVDDTNTFGVLAAEGFLPGYGLEIGSVLGMAEVPKWVRGLSDFELPRPPSIALREYVPGNLIYANGQRFVPRRFARQVGEAQKDVLVLQVNVQRQSVHEVGNAAGGDPGALVIKSLPVCDVTLVHQSRISDEEENRFQLGVHIFGRELGQHNGGHAFRWGPKVLQFRKGVRLQLVNVGAPAVVASRKKLGYPVCIVCGQSLSPFASETESERFKTNHKEWCGKEPEGIGFHAELAVDAITIPGCQDRTEAYSVMEALRFAAAELLNMDTEDLQVMVVGHPDRDDCDALLYDPMPGGSGLLEQFCQHFPALVDQAKRIGAECPGLCAASCIDCLQTYRNAAYHKYLDRALFLERAESWGRTLVDHAPIPSTQAAAKPVLGETPVNQAERKLRGMLEKLSFPPGRWQIQQLLPHPLGSTTPDITYDDPDDDTHKVFVYLDGMSDHIHGNAETRQRDLQIRNELRSEGHEVIPITAQELDDMQAMTRHFKRLGRLLIGQDAATRVAGTPAEWFAAREAVATAIPAAVTAAAPKAAPAKSTVVLPFEWVTPDTSADQGVTCVPVFDLRPAAGDFSDAQTPEITGWGRPQLSRKITQDMFIAQVCGKSMEPKIPDGSWCLFTRAVAGSRHGRILLVQHRDIHDPDTGNRYTVKEYRRPPQDVAKPNGRAGAITLHPLNPEYRPIPVTPAQAEHLAVVGEWLAVLKAGHES